MVFWASGGSPGLVALGLVAGAIFLTFFFLNAMFHLSTLTGRKWQGGRSLYERPPVIRWECGGGRCRAANPPQARFCRMCGRPRT